MSIKTYKIETVLAAHNAGAKVLSVEKKRDDKVFKGVRYLNMVWRFAGITSDGWFTFRNFTLSRGIADPNDISDKRNEHGDKQRLKFESTLSLAGELGQFLMAFNPLWKAEVGTLLADGTVKAANKMIHAFVQTHYSEKNEKRAGEEMDEPLIRINIDFSAYPAKHPNKFLAGKPKTEILDFEKPYVKDGVTHYHPATVQDPDTGVEVPVNESNIHLFATKGAIIHLGRLFIGNASVSSQGIAAPRLIARAIMSRGPEEGFVDEDDGLEAALIPEVPPANTTAGEPGPGEEPAAAEPTGEPVADDVDDMLDGLV